MAHKLIVLHSPLNPVEFAARFRQRVDIDEWWEHGPLAWFAGKEVVGEIDGLSFTLRRLATFSRGRVPTLIFNGQFSEDLNGGTRIEGYFALASWHVMLVRVVGIGLGSLLLLSDLDLWIRNGPVQMSDGLSELLIPIWFLSIGLLYPPLARLFAKGSEGFLLNFMRKNLMAQSDKVTDLPTLDSEMR